MTVLWAILIVPSLLWWSQSVKWIVIMSVWANLAGHFSAWQAARIENKEEERDGPVE
jgi:general stress protein CsbA